MFYIINDKQIVLADDEKQRLETTLRLIPEYAGYKIQESDICSAQEYEKTPMKWMIEDGVLEENPNWAEVEAQREMERLKMLSMTPLDFITALVGFGSSLEYINEFLEANLEAKMSLTYCNKVYRGNPLLDASCGYFNVTPVQLDELFRERGS